MAKIDLGDVMGPRGERGSIIYQGTAITGMETRGTVFANSGIEYALQEDKYLNTLTNDMYTCITEGDADTAEWAWIGNIQGKQGLPGAPGATGQVDMTTPIDYTPAETRQDMESGDSLGILMGKIDKNFADMTDAAYLPVVNDLETARAGEGVLDAYQGKVLSEKIDEYTSDYFSPAKSYEVGDLCIYENKLYKFVSKKDPGEWDSFVVKPTNIADQISELNSNLNHTYVGRDLTQVFASEIGNYSDEWAWIQARLNTRNVLDVHVGDYIPLTVGSENHIAEIAGINTYHCTGNADHVVGYHIDWISRDCYGATVQFNTANTNQGNATQGSPFLVSNLKKWLDGTLYPLLPEKVRRVIKAKRVQAPRRYSASGSLTDDNGWAWVDLDKLWIPFEFEIFGTVVWSTKGYGCGQAIQYPIFANSSEHRVKGIGLNGEHCGWWTASASSIDATRIVYVHAYGYSNNTTAGDTGIYVPVCFRTMEEQ